MQPAGALQTVTGGAIAHGNHSSYKQDMARPDHVLIVDDDEEIRDLLRAYLGRNGFRTSGAADGPAMWEALSAGDVDLIVLDVMLPGEDGLTLCRNLRARSHVPILMLTARGEDVDRILGLEMGADDYLPKPFNPRELLARIKSVLRRAHTLPGRMTDADAPKEFRFAGWTLDTVARQLVSGQGVVVALSSAEYRLLLILLTHANQVLSRDQLMNLIHHRDAGPFDRGIDIQISRLRQRLGEDAREPRLIKTVRNEGYVLAVPVTAVG